MTQFRELTDRYTLEKILRSTRAGTVLRAIDNRTGQAVAVKLITVTSPPLLVQKAPELETLGAALTELREPGLPAVTDFGFTTDGSAFLVMDLLDGKTLDTLAGPPQRLLGLLAQALGALEALARRGIAHRNLRPDNLLVLGAPPEERVQLLGLGSAIFRTPEPGSPPQAPGDWRADLESFARTTCQVLGIAVTSDEPPSAQMPFALSLELENSEALRRILERCLRRDPAERPSHAEIRDAFRLALGELPAAPRLVIPSAPAPVTAAAPPPQFLQMPPRPAVPLATAVASLEPEPVPSDDQELLPVIDDDVLDALATAPPAPVDPAAPPAGRVVPFRGAGSAVAEPPPKKPNPVLRPSVLIALASVLILGAAGAFWWLSRNPAPQEAIQAEAPPPPPRRPATEVLAEAQEAIADVRWDSALAALGSLTPADQATLTPAGCRSLLATEESLALFGADHLPGILQTGLKQGDLGSLRFAVWAADTQGAAQTPEVQTDLARGRSILELYAGIEDAAAREADTEVLEKFGALEKDLPGASDPQGLREKAAARLEAQAETLAREGKYEDALARLDSVLRNWPKREPARERSGLYAKARQLTRDQEALLEVLPAALRRKKPHEGLEQLKGVEPVPHLAARFADLRKQLEEQLAFADQKPPQISLRDGFFLDYDRGQVVELSFRVTDDYLVRNVKLMARPEGGKMREIGLEKSTLGYTAKLPVDFHRNATVELYVVATDPSGHEGFFGTPEVPKLLQRRRGFERLVN
jgi:serine/threonine-protein kinase